jgi:hypothetical protein
MRYLKKFLNENSSKLKERLKIKLLSFGGKDVKLGLDTEEEQLRMLNGGKIYNDKINYVSGSPNQCHRNVSDKYQKSSNHGFKIVSGYGLCDDTWIQHSWGHNRNGIIETTMVKFDLYYGYELTPEESDEFCFLNY